MPKIGSVAFVVCLPTLLKQKNQFFSSLRNLEQKFIRSAHESGKIERFYKKFSFFEKNWLHLAESVQRLIFCEIWLKIVHFS